MSESLLFKYLYITAVVSAYWIVSISMVFVNKTLLSSDVIHLDAPFFITWSQCVISVIIILVMDKLALVYPDYFTISTEPYSLNRETSRKVLLLSIIFTAMIASNNFCLKHVGVSFYYIGRSLTTVFNVIFTYIILNEKLSLGTIVCCAIIVFGFLLGVDQENINGTLSISGVIYGILGSLSVSLFSIGTKKVLPSLNQDIWRLSYYNNLYSSYLFLPLMLLNGEFVTLYNYDNFWNIDFWVITMLAGIFGFAIGYVTALQIKVTSALTHNISGTAKSCVQTVLATYWYEDHKSSLWWTSNFLVLGGSAAYARVKQLNMKKQFNLLSPSQK